MIAPWDSLGFQILFVYIILIILVCWFGGRLEKHREARHREEARARWRARQDRLRAEQREYDRDRWVA